MAKGVRGSRDEIERREGLACSFSLLEGLIITPRGKRLCLSEHSNRLRQKIGDRQRERERKRETEYGSVRREGN